MDTGGKSDIQKRNMYRSDNVMLPVFTDPVLPKKKEPTIKPIEKGEIVEADGSIKDALNSLLIILGGDNANQSESN